MHVRVISQLTAGAAALAMASMRVLGAADSMQEVPIGGFLVPPAGDLRELEDRLELHPMALIGVGWNSNVDPAEGRGSDFFGRAIIGILARYLPNPDWEVQLDGELERLHYARLRDQDATIGRAVLHADYTGPEVTIHNTAGWIRTQDALVISGEQVLRDDYDIQSRLRHQGAEFWQETLVDADYLKYQGATSLFGIHQADHATYTGELRLGSGDVDDEEWLSSRGELVEYRTTAHFNDDRALVETVGRIMPFGPRTSGHAVVGVAIRQYSDNTLHDPAYDDRTEIWPVADIGANWEFEKDSNVGVDLFSSVTDGLATNAETHLGANSLAQVRLLRRCFIGAIAGVSFDRNSGAPYGYSPVTRTVEHGQVSIQYALPAGFCARVHADEWRSLNGYSYQLLVIGADMAYAY